MTFFLSPGNFKRGVFGADNSKIRGPSPEMPQTGSPLAKGGLVSKPQIKGGQWPGPKINAAKFPQDNPPPPPPQYFSIGRCLTWLRSSLLCRADIGHWVGYLNKYFEFDIRNFDKWLEGMLPEACSK
jgi:hypothetical protein